MSNKEKYFRYILHSSYNSENKELIMRSTKKNWTSGDIDLIW